MISPPHYLQKTVFCRYLVPPVGFEPTALRSGGARSNPLSYEGTREGNGSTFPPRARHPYSVSGLRARSPAPSRRPER